MPDVLKTISKAHTQYKLASGTKVPGVTTVLSLLNKPALVKWANNLGLQGIDSNKYRDAAADIGTLAHAMIQAHLQNEKLDTSQYSAQQIDLAENAALSYFEWAKQYNVQPIFCEIPLVSEKYQFGGTIDCYCRLNNELTLLDFKTGKAIYDEYFVQLAAYKQLLTESGHKVKKCRILRIGRDETEGFEERVADRIDKYFSVFKHLLEVYKLKKQLNWN